MATVKKSKKWDNITKLGMSLLLLILVESIVLTILVLKQQANPDNKVVNAQGNVNNDMPEGNSLEGTSGQ